MKKLILLMFASLFLFSCSLFAPVNDIEVHNTLVAKMDNLLDAEKAFYNVYIRLNPGDDVKKVEENYKGFQLAVDDLDKYFKSAKFVSYQEIFYQSYKEFYKDFIFEYAKLSGEFISELKDRGVVFDVINKYSSGLDQFSINFVDMHNRLIDIINQQSDV